MGRAMAIPMEKTDSAAMGGTFPLCMAGEGSTVQVCRIKGNPETRRHLECLGFVEGSQITVVSQANGNMIVESKGARIALGSQMATRLLVAPA